MTTLPPVTPLAPSPPIAASGPVSLRRIRADAIRRNALAIDHALADALDAIQDASAKPKLSAHVPRDGKGRRVPDPEPEPLDLEPIRAILERHDLGDGIPAGSPSAQVVEGTITALRAQLTATRDRTLAELARGTARADHERFRYERALGVAA